MDSPLITCVVPVFNGELYLREALDSILGQTHRPLEVVVVDDGSTDGTAGVIDSYGDAVRRLRQANRGPASARNAGIAAARGDLVAFLDADDRWHPEKLARQAARFAAHPRLGYCVTMVRNFWIPELHREEERLRDHRIARPIAGYTSGTLLVRRDLFARIGRFDPAIDHGDVVDWLLRAKEQGVAEELIPEVLCYRRLHRSNRSRSRAAASRDSFLKLAKAHLDRGRGLE